MIDRAWKVVNGRTGWLIAALFAYVLAAEAAAQVPVESAPEATVNTTAPVDQPQAERRLPRPDVNPETEAETEPALPPPLARKPTVGVSLAPPRTSTTAAPPERSASSESVVTDNTPNGVLATAMPPPATAPIVTIDPPTPQRWASMPWGIIALAGAGAIVVIAGIAQLLNRRRGRRRKARGSRFADPIPWLPQPDEGSDAAPPSPLPREDAKPKSAPHPLPDPQPEALPLMESKPAVPPRQPQFTPPMRVTATPPVPAPAPSLQARAWLDVELTVPRAGIEGDAMLVDFELDIHNRGDLTATEVRVTAQLISSSPRQEMQLDAVFASRTATPLVAPATVAPGAQLYIRATGSIPLDRINRLDLGGRPLFVPILAVRAGYLWEGGDSGEGVTGQAFILGIRPDGRAGADKMVPFWLDIPPRMFDTIDHRLHDRAARL